MKTNYVKIPKWCTHSTLHLAVGAPGLEVLSTRFQADSLLCMMVDSLDLTLLGYTDPTTEMDAKNTWSLSKRRPSPPTQVRAVMTGHGFASASCDLLYRCPLCLRISALLPMCLHRSLFDDYGFSKVRIFSECRGGCGCGAFWFTMKCVGRNCGKSHKGMVHPRTGQEGPRGLNV
jgi:hypothetical protein